MSTDPVPRTPNGGSKSAHQRYHPDNDEYDGPERRRQHHYRPPDIPGAAGGPSATLVGWMAFAISLGTGVGIAIGMFQLLNAPILLRIDNLSQQRHADVIDLRERIKGIEETMGRNNFVPEARRLDMLSQIRDRMDALQTQINANEVRLRRVENVCVATGRFQGELDER